MLIWRLKTKPIYTEYDIEMMQQITSSKYITIEPSEVGKKFMISYLKKNYKNI